MIRCITHIIFGLIIVGCLVWEVIYVSNKLLPMKIQEVSPKETSDLMKCEPQCNALHKVTGLIYDADSGKVSCVCL